jgi:hypothetical protein
MTRIQTLAAQSSHNEAIIAILLDTSSVNKSHKQDKEESHLDDYSNDKGILALSRISTLYVPYLNPFKNTKLPLSC